MRGAGIDEGFERAEVELEFFGLVNAEDGAGGGSIAQGDAHAVAGHDFEPLGDGVVKDKLGGTVDENLGGGHRLFARLESLTGMKSAKRAIF